MSTAVTKSQIVKDGLRYKTKAAGSPFGETNQYAHTATMSCFLCGKHRPRNQPMTRKLLGKAQNVCASMVDEKGQLCVQATGVVRISLPN